MLLIGKREPPNDDGATAKPDAVEVSPEVSSIPGAPAAVDAAETKKKTAEIAWLQKQIPEKMTRIRLMRLFEEDAADRNQRKYAMTDLLKRTRYT